MQRKNKNRRKVLRDRLLMFVAFVILFLCSIKLGMINNKYNKADNEYENIKNTYVDNDMTRKDKTNKRKTEKEGKSEIETEIEKANPIDFEGLKKENKDIVGWLEIESINISYPIVQGKDNGFYLNHGFNKNKLFTGSIFMNTNNKPDFTDQNTIIYGHNMRDGSMFGRLKRVKSQEIQKQEPYFYVYTESKIIKYEIIVVKEVSINSENYQMRFSKNKTIKELSIKDSDKILTLSTCTNDDNTRLIVQGKKVN